MRISTTCIGPIWPYLGNRLPFVFHRLTISRNFFLPGHRMDGRSVQPRTWYLSRFCPRIERQWLTLSASARRPFFRRHFTLFLKPAILVRSVWKHLGVTEPRACSLFLRPGPSRTHATERQQRSPRRGSSHLWNIILLEWWKQISSVNLKPTQVAWTVIGTKELLLKIKICWDLIN